MNAPLLSVCVTGLGHVGYPTALLLSELGFSVTGVDIDTDRLAKITPTPFDISLEPQEADVHLIAVPTPLGSGKKADLSAVEQAVDSLLPVLDSSNLVVLESTCPIGTTQRIAERLRTVDSSVSVAYSPERAIPGNMREELLHNNRVVGGVDPASTQRAVDFYQSFVQGQVCGTDAPTAECVKLAENAYRDLNIAYANQLSMIADRVNIDVDSVIELANRHPRVEILQPGPGVGGHCIAVDPWFLVNAAPDLATLSTEARYLNERKTQYVLEAIEQAGARTVALFGQTYKANVADFRYSPAVQIADRLSKTVNVLRVDPFLDGATPATEALEQADLLVGLVPHDAFRKINPWPNTPQLDFAGVFA